MEEASLSLLSDLKEKCAVSADDVITLRREVFGDGVVARDEAEWIFDLNETIDDPILSWSDFFVEALSGYFLGHSGQRGYVSEEAGAFLIKHVSRDGRIQSASELELVVNVIDKALATPPALVDFALNTLKECVLTGEGPLVRNPDLKPGVLGQAEVDLIERVIFGTGSQGNIAVSKSEAEFLFDLNDQTVQSENDPAWRRLFVRGVANYLMAALSYVAPSQEEAARREAWLEEDSSTGGFFGRMLSSLGKGLPELLGALSVDKEIEAQRAQRLEDQQARIRVNEAITNSEAEWVITRIEKDGIIHDNERALLQFVAENSPEIDPRLEPLLKKVA